MVAQAHTPAGNKHPATHAVEKPAPEQKAAPEQKSAYPAQWRADKDAPIVAPLITAGTYTTQQYVYIQFPLNWVLLTTTGVSVINSDATYVAWVAVPNTTGPIQSVARPAGS